MESQENKADRIQALRRQFDAGLARYLATTGGERQTLTLELLRLKWNAEDLESQGAFEKASLAAAAGSKLFSGGVE